MFHRLVGLDRLDHSHSWSVSHILLEKHLPFHCNVKVRKASNVTVEQDIAVSRVKDLKA